jgi:RIO kinase 1
MIKGGKEASVYQCLAGDFTYRTYLAAKVYRPRQFRNLKNDFVYRENRDYLDENGHVIRDTRMNHAIKKKSSYGQKLSHVSWIEHEVNTMNLLKSAGADIPEAFASGDNAILMTYIGGDELAAPTLNEINLPIDLARRLFERVIFNIELMLANQRIHADLSAYNILFWDDEITIIDFPQAINPYQNQSSWPIFRRDVTRVCQYFQRQNVRVDAEKMSVDLWKKFKFPAHEAEPLSAFEEYAQEDKK